MKKLFFFFLIPAMLIGQKSLERDKTEILALLQFQQEAWSNHDLEGFMESYWRSTSLKFYGNSGLTLGWEQTLANYRKSYPTKEHTGQLKFTIDDISRIGKGAYHVMGQYHLTRSVGDANGVFFIIIKKIKGKWRIVADMSC